jgi:HEPN domain-containing protein
MGDNVQYWIELSDYDYETAEAMLQSGRYLYVGFMCHQTIEKILKAYFSSKNQEPVPFTHSLSYIAKKANIYDEFTDENKDFLDMLEPLNIEARYPSQKERLMKSLSNAKCKELLKFTKELQLWIKKKL